MDLSSYQEDAHRVAIYPGQGQLQGLLYTALGLGEAGELQGKVKKILRDDNREITDERRQQLIDEAGDILWYLALFAEELDTSLSTIAERNLEKLLDRQDRGVLHGSGDTR